MHIKKNEEEKYMNKSGKSQQQLNYEQFPNEKLFCHAFLVNCDYCVPYNHVQLS